MKKKICADCKIFYEEEACPICRKNQVATSWQGRINFLNKDKSLIAKKIAIEQNGEYAIKVR